MPTPAGDSAIHLKIFNGSTEIGECLLSPIPSGVVGVESITNLHEISPTQGNIYAMIYISSGSSTLNYLENTPEMSYTHGGTKIYQNAHGFY